MPDIDKDNVDEVKKLFEKFKVITDNLEDKCYDITYSNINEFRNYIKFIMTVSFTVIPITFTCLSVILANKTEFEQVPLYSIGIGLIFSLVTIILAFYGGLPEIKPITKDRLEELEDILKNKLKWLYVTVFGLLAQILFIGVGFILIVI